MELDKPFDLREVLAVLFRHKWLILLSVVLSATIAAFYVMRLPRVYTATATLEYDLSPPRPLGREIEDMSEVSRREATYWRGGEWCETQNKIIGSRAVAEIAARRLGLHRDPWFLGLPKGQPVTGYSVQDAAVMLQGMVTVEQQEGTLLVDVSVRDSDPERATMLANAVVDAYFEKVETDRDKNVVGALTWLNKQLDDLKEDLEQSEIALHKFKTEHNALSVSLEDRQNLIAKDIQRYSEELTNTRLRRIALSARLKGLREVDRDDPTDVHNRWLAEDESLAELRHRYVGEQARRQELATRYGDEHPEMKQLDANLAALRKQLVREIDGLIERTEADLEEAETREVKIGAALARVNKAGLELNRDEIEFRKLARDQKNKENIYEILLGRTAQTDLTRLMHVSNVKLVERALVPTAPIAARASKYIIIGIILGLVLGIGLAFLLENLDTRIRSPEQVEGAGLVVLGILPAMRSNLTTTDQKGWRRWRRRKNGRGKPHSPDRDLIVHNEPTSPVAECCRAIRTGLMFTFSDRSRKTLMVTSPNPLEGKTTVAISLAIAMAQSGKKVLLVDADMRRPRVHHSLGVSADVGLNSVLSGECELTEAVQPTFIEGLYALPSGPIPPNPSELLQDNRFEELIEQAAASHDWVVFDSPPLSAVTDAAVLGSQVAGSLIVVKSDSTTHERLRSSIKQLKGLGTTLVGAVLNNVNISNKWYSYGYHYYRDYEAYVRKPQGQPEADQSKQRQTA